jgi:hypothetical protein
MMAKYLNMWLKKMVKNYLMRKNRMKILTKKLKKIVFLRAMKVKERSQEISLRKYHQMG